MPENCFLASLENANLQWHMKTREFLEGLSCVSLRTLGLAVRDRSKVRQYISSCLKKYDELTGNGLPSRGPLTPDAASIISLPAAHAGGGMSFTELVILARVTRVLQPKAVFEMGTYNGLTTAVFLLNSNPDAQIVTLDLPPGSVEDESYIRSDQQLVVSRQLGSVPQAMGLRPYTQLLCDSMVFDPSPYSNSVELGLVDAAHDLAHVRNDTIKMASMITDQGMVFWHDYGGKGSLLPLANYLDGLGKRALLYRIPDTSLAWALGRELKKAVDGSSPHVSRSATNQAKGRGRG
jgi:hypothetical protein